MPVRLKRVMALAARADVHDGRELIPRIRAGVAGIDRESAAAA